MDIVRLDTTGGRRSISGPEEEAAYLRDLRVRSAEALERAFGFLAAQPDEWARLRARVLCGAEPVSNLVDALTKRQRADGSLPLATLMTGGGLGFPPVAAASLGARDQALVGTLEALLMAADARVLHGPWLERAARFLEGEQSEDGAFRLEASCSGPGGLVRGPEDEAADVFFTGLIAGLLGGTPLSRAETLERAGAWLAERFSPDAVEQSADPGDEQRRYAALTAYALFFTNVGHELADEALQWCGRALEKGFRSRRHDAVATMRIVLCCDAQAMPGAELDVVELLERVLEEQARDGGFAQLSLAGPAGRTTQTFDAMFAIVRLCAALAPDASGPA